VKCIVPLIMMIWVGGVAPCVLALPDLVVSQIDIVPTSPVAGTPVTFVVTIENIGSSDVKGMFRVVFKLDGLQIDALSIPSGLAGGTAQSLSIPWTAKVGPHVFSVEVDAPFDRIKETDEGNNTEVFLFTVPLSEQAAEMLESLKIAVARFEDLSGSALVNVGGGVTDKLIERLVSVGLHVLERSEFEAVMQERSFNPTFTGDVSAAGRLLGADLLIVGSVTDVDVQEMSISFGFLNFNSRFKSAAVDVAVTARLVNTRTSEIISTFSAEGHDEGTTGFSIDFGRLLPFLQSGSPNLCVGGFVTDRPWHYVGETVPFGYRNPGMSGWFGVEIYTGGGAFVRWLGWRFVNAGDCSTWVWDQKNTSSVQMNPGVYTAKLWNGTSYIATADFQIRPGVSLSAPPVDEITVGSARFDDTVVGSALNKTLDQLVSSVLQAVEDVAPLLAEQESLPAAVLVAPRVREGQIAAILPDGRFAINLGASSGVTKGDFFEVLAVENVIVDPQTHEILAYDVLTVKGEIVVTEVRDRVSYTVPTSKFAPGIGDIVRRVPP